MADADLKISQRHYDILLTTPAPNADSFPEVTASVVQVAELLDEYVILEDATADFDIEFSVAGALIPSVSKSRSGYTINVGLNGDVTPGQILNAISSDLVEIYDEQDSEYEDDLLDLQIALDLDSSQNITLTPPPPPRKKSKKKRKSKDESQTELTFFIEETSPEELEEIAQEIGQEIEQDVQVEQELSQEIEQELEQDVQVEQELTQEIEQDLEQDVQVEPIGTGKLYEEIVQFILDNPGYARALKLPEDFGSLDRSIQILTLLAKNQPAFILKLINRLRATSKVWDIPALTLIYWFVHTANLAREERFKSTFTFPEGNSRWDVDTMSSVGVEGGWVRDVVAPALESSKKILINALVILSPDRDSTSLVDARKQSFNAIREYVGEHYLTELPAALGREYSDLIEAVDLLNRREVLQKALGLKGQWSSLSDPEKAIAIAIKGSQTVSLKQVHKSIAEECERSGAEASQEEKDLLLTLSALGNLADLAYDIISPEQGDRFNESFMESVDDPSCRRVSKVLLFGIFNNRTTMKAVVKCKEIVGEEQAESVDTDSFYEGLVQTVLDNPAYTKALEVGDKFQSLNAEMQIVSLINSALSEPVVRLKQTIVNEAAENPQGLVLLDWAISVRNIRRVRKDRITYMFPDFESFFDRQTMLSTRDVSSGYVTDVVFPALSIFNKVEKALVEVSKRRDENSRAAYDESKSSFEMVSQYVQDHYIADLPAALGSQYSTFTDILPLLDRDPDLQKALEVQEIWGEMSVPEKVIALISSNEAQLKRVHKHLATECKATGVKPTDDEEDLLALLVELVNMEKNRYEILIPEKDDSFDKQLMESVDGGRCLRVNQSLLWAVPQIPRNRDSKVFMKAVVLCEDQR